jgi:hypothetical protein
MFIDVLLDWMVLFKDSTSFWDKAVISGCLVPFSIINRPCYHWPSRQWDRLYLVTWNCRHIDNAEAKPLIRSVCAVHGYTCPEICTPEELMGGASDEG